MESLQEIQEKVKEYTEQLAQAEQQMAQLAAFREQLRGAIAALQGLEIMSTVEPTEDIEAIAVEVEAIEDE